MTKQDDQPQDTPDAQHQIVADIVMREIAGNPRFKLAPNTGEGFVIVSVMPSLLY